MVLWVSRDKSLQDLLMGLGEKLALYLSFLVSDLLQLIVDGLDVDISD
jgi:hypothetical protein